METFLRNKTTAQQAMALEDRLTHPFRVGRQHSAEYFELLAQRRRLPVSALRQQFLDAYHKAQVLVLSSETGAGKTTQIPQFILFDEFASGKMIACTQPRRLAAISVAQRVAEELDVPLGTTVGYAVRFDTKFDKNTRIKYVTDGLLLQEAKGDRNFSKYSCVIVDEAHERTMATDIVLALLKIAVQARGDLKIIIMSATLDVERFSTYFEGSSFFNVPGRLYPVDVKYLEEPTANYFHCGITLAYSLHQSQGSGDILLFLPTVEMVEKACVLLKEHTTYLEVFPLYAELPKGAQHRALLRYTNRKCVVATGVAETSLTIDGIVFVIDTGIAKLPGYNPRASMNTLLTGPISKASANQRAGRAGRTGPGICFRIYTFETFEACFIGSAPPAILTTEVLPEVLLLKSMGHEQVASFDFLNPFHNEPYLRALEDLKDMQYIDETGKITESGNMAARLPVHPIWYNAIIEAHNLGCSEEMVALAALSSTQHSIFVRPHQQRFDADLVHRRWFNPLSDHITQLNALHAYVNLIRRGMAQAYIDRWCLKHFLSRSVLDEVLKIRKQLKLYVENMLHEQTKSVMTSDEDYHTNIRKALARSLYHHAAIQSKKLGDRCYTTVHGNIPAGVDPGSSVVGFPHEWVVYNTFGYAGMPYLRTATVVDLEWLIDLDYFKDERFPRKRGPNPSVRQPAVKASLDEARAKRLEKIE